jgi:hypothetical protein
MTFAATSADGTIIGLSTNDLIDLNSVSDNGLQNGTFNLNNNDPTYQLFAANGGGLNVDLPPANGNSAGKTFWICENGGGANLTVREQGAGALSAVFQNQARLFMCDGTNWNIASLS